MCRSNEKALQMAWELLKKGKAKAISIASIFGILFYVIFALPTLGIIAQLFLTLLIISFLIYIGNLFLLEKEEDIINKFTNSSLSEILFSKVANGIGFWVGLILVEILLAIVIGIIFGILTIFGDAGILLGAIFTILITFLFLYIYPALLGEVFSSISFSDAFKKVFLIFNLSFIKKTFNSNYFFFVFVWSLVISSLFFIMLTIIGIALLPLIQELFLELNGMNFNGVNNINLSGGFYFYLLIISILFAFMIFYFLVYSSIVAVFAKDKISNEDNNEKIEENKENS